MTQSQPSDTAGKLDASFAVLADHHHRAVFTYLAETTTGEVTGLDSTVVTRDELADYFETRFGMTQSQATATLHHTVLPKLADFALVDYDNRTGDVRVADADTVASILTLAARGRELFTPE